MSELELLRRFAPPETTPTTAAEQAARAALLEHARRRRRGRRPVLLAVPLLAAAAIVVAFVLAPRENPATDERPAAPPHAAAASALVPSRPLKPGRYLYTRSHGAALTTVGDAPAYSALVPSEREIWLALDGTGWSKGTSGKPTWLSARDRRRWIQSGRPELGGGRDDSPLGSNDQDGPAPMTTPELPADPDRLYAYLEGRIGDRGEAYMFTEVADALRGGYTTPQQRAALFEVLGRIPGVDHAGAADDRAGRPGIAFALDDAVNKLRTELILDPATHALLGEQETTLRGYWADYEPGTLIAWTVVERVEVVDRIKQRPTAR